MIATNINIDEFISVLQRVKEEGDTDLINLEMVPDPKYVGMNKIIIHPIEESQELIPDNSNSNNSNSNSNSDDNIISDIKISTDNNDIFKIFNSLI